MVYTSESELFADQACGAALRARRAVSRASSSSSIAAGKIAWSRDAVMGFQSMLHDTIYAEEGQVSEQERFDGDLVGGIEHAGAPHLPGQPRAPAPGSGTLRGRVPRRRAARHIDQVESANVADRRATWQFRATRSAPACRASPDEQAASHRGDERVHARSTSG